MRRTSHITPGEIDPKRLYSRTEAARALDVSRSTIYRWESLGFITARKHAKTGRMVYRGADLQTFNNTTRRPC